MEEGSPSRKHAKDGQVKIRKPYLLTKPRTSWMKDEHAKFLTAVGLYGRNWKKIEEYVGTKSSVQIRSHAQKHFAKVERGDAGTETIAIPPPRFKRKSTKPSSAEQQPQHLHHQQHAGQLEYGFAGFAPSSSKHSSKDSAFQLPGLQQQGDAASSVPAAANAATAANIHAQLQALVASHNAQLLQEHAKNDMLQPGGSSNFSWQPGSLSFDLEQALSKSQAPGLPAFSSGFWDLHSAPSAPSVLQPSVILQPPPPLMNTASSAPVINTVDLLPPLGGFSLSPTGTSSLPAHLISGPSIAELLGGANSTPNAVAAGCPPGSTTPGAGSTPTAASAPARGAHVDAGMERGGRGCRYGEGSCSMEGSSVGRRSGAATATTPAATKVEYRGSAAAWSSGGGGAKTSSCGPNGSWDSNVNSGSGSALVSGDNNGSRGCDLWRMGSNSSCMTGAGIGLGSGVLRPQPRRYHVQQAPLPGQKLGYWAEEQQQGRERASGGALSDPNSRAGSGSNEQGPGAAPAPGKLALDQQQVNVGSTPQVNVGSTPQVNVGSTPQVNVGSTPQVAAGAGGGWQQQQQQHVSNRIGAPEVVASAVALLPGQQQAAGAGQDRQPPLAPVAHEMDSKLPTLAAKVLAGMKATNTADEGGACHASGAAARGRAGGVVSAKEPACSSQVGLGGSDTTHEVKEAQAQAEPAKAGVLPLAPGTAAAAAARNASGRGVVQQGGGSGNSGSDSGSQGGYQHRSKHQRRGGHPMTGGNSRGGSLDVLRALSAAHSLQRNQRSSIAHPSAVKGSCVRPHGLGMRAPVLRSSPPLSEADAALLAANAALGPSSLQGGVSGAFSSPTAPMDAAATAPIASLGVEQQDSNAWAVRSGCGSDSKSGASAGGSGGGSIDCPGAAGSGGLAAQRGASTSREGSREGSHNDNGEGEGSGNGSRNGCGDAVNGNREVGGDASVQGKGDSAGSAHIPGPGGSGEGGGGREGSCEGEGAVLSRDPASHFDTKQAPTALTTSAQGREDVVTGAESGGQARQQEEAEGLEPPYTGAAGSARDGPSAFAPYAGHKQQVTPQGGDGMVQGPQPA